VQDSWRTLSVSMRDLAPDREWISFSARSDHLLDPETPLRNPETINYPSKEDPSVIPVHTGLLERKKRFSRTYRESYFVLTPAGFLHEYASSDVAKDNAPIFSLFLPACTLGPPSSAKGKSHKFHIEGKKDGTGSTKTGSFRRALGSSDHAWSFRSRSREDMMEWWNDIRMLCARYLVASEHMERSGPVEAAVRAAGYVSESDEELEDDEEEEGSSIEEEEDEQYELADENTQDVGDELEPPSYTQPEKPIEDVRTFFFDRIFPRDLCSMWVQLDKKGADVSRRPSKRQMEKAPEGKPPHEHNGGVVHNESRFTEVL
jgi:hypothetical protein